MTKKAATDDRRRTQVKSLPRPETELTPDEQRQVKGGVGGMRIGDGGGPVSTGAGGGSEAQGVPHLLRPIE